MIFICLCRWKGRLSKETAAQSAEYVEQMKKKKGVKILGFYWTVGRYNSVFIFEEKATENESISQII